MASRDVRKVDVVVVVLCLAVLCMCLGAVDQMGREQARRRVCGTQLSGLGKAMLIYSNDYEDELPKAGARTNKWVPKLSNWRAPRRQKAYGIKERVGKVTISSSLYLLVKYAEVTPRHFVCPSEPDKREFKLKDVPEKLGEDVELIDAWDFGGYYDADNNPSQHCSYAYHTPLGAYALTTSNEPGMAVLADSSPWMDAKRSADPNLGWKQFMSGSSEEPGLGNSDAHQRQGQNVLFLDSHVAFEARATCGVDDDNIYTMQPEKRTSGTAKAIMPRAYGKITPGGRKDSVLIQDGDRPVMPKEPKYAR